jgi:hypothetical protein
MPLQKCLEILTVMEVIDCKVDVDRKPLSTTATNMRGTFGTACAAFLMDLLIGSQPFFPRFSADLEQYWLCRLSADFMILEWSFHEKQRNGSRFCSSEGPDFDSDLVGKVGETGECGALDR